MNNPYDEARRWYDALGVDTDAALEALQKVSISLPCWQGDDVRGFENLGQTQSGGIQATGSYMGRARTATELMADIDFALSLIPGKHRVNLHACYAVWDGERVERDALSPRHFAPWIEFARLRRLGLYFNATFFAHPRVKHGLTLSSPDEETRAFWVRHGIACRRIAAAVACELGKPVLHNIWIPDGFKDVPADRLGPRLRLQRSLDEIFAERLPGVIDSVESKAFGIGRESYTVGSSEFYLTYAAQHPGVYPLLDNGHFHPTETVSDKIPALLAFYDKLPLHVTRPVRWDSDHVVLLDDELEEIAKEVVRNDALDRVLIGLDFFDASINRVAAWVVGTRSVQKALLHALLQPAATMKGMQDDADFTALMVLAEAAKTGPIGAVWDEFCRGFDVPVETRWLSAIRRYEADVLSRRSDS